MEKEEYYNEPNALKEKNDISYMLPKTWAPQRKTYTYEISNIIEYGKQHNSEC